MTLTLPDIVAIVIAVTLMRPVSAAIRFFFRLGANSVAEKVLERIHGKDMATVMIAQSAEEPVEQLMRTFIAPGTVKLDTERRPIRRSNIGR